MLPLLNHQSSFYMTGCSVFWKRQINRNAYTHAYISTEDPQHNELCQNGLCCSSGSDKSWLCYWLSQLLHTDIHIFSHFLPFYDRMYISVAQFAGGIILHYHWLLCRFIYCLDLLNYMEDHKKTDQASRVGCPRVNVSFYHVNRTKVRDKKMSCSVSTTSVLRIWKCCSLQ